MTQQPPADPPLTPAQVPQQVPQQPPPRPPVQDSQAQTILILGIISFMFLPLGPVAWYMGHQYLKQCKARGVAPDGAAQAGYFCGIATSIICAMLILWFVLWFVLMIVFFVFFLAFYVLLFAIMLIGGAASM